LRNLGRNEAGLYLLVETTLSPKSSLRAGLLRAMTRSPVGATGLSHGHCHLRLRVRVRGVGWPGKDALPSSDQPCGCPACGAGSRARGRPLSCERIGSGVGSRRSSSSKNGSIVGGYRVTAGLAPCTSRANDSSESMSSSQHNLVSRHCCPLFGTPSRPHASATLDSHSTATDPQDMSVSVALSPAPCWPRRPCVWGGVAGQCGLDVRACVRMLT
jgi:hypothetical protein